MNEETEREKNKRLLKKIGRDKRIRARKEKRGQIGKHTQVIGRDGPSCPRCSQPTLILEHTSIGPKQTKQPFFYSRWYKCTNTHCRTKLIMPPEFRVFRDEEARAKFEQRPKLTSDIALQVLDTMSPQPAELYDGESPPWE